MRFIHTADWHLGRLFHGVHLTGDQRFALHGLIEIAEKHRVDAVIVSGDIFDRAVPPPEAVELLNEILMTLSLDLRVPVVVIAGNHDSAARLEYLSGIARQSHLHLVGRVGPEPRPVLVEGRDGTMARFWPLAYTEPETARFELGREDIRSHEDALACQLNSIEDCLSGKNSGNECSCAAHEVVVAHAYVAGCTESESERPLSVGGTGAVRADVFADYAYVALGHLHEPQWAGGARSRYSGSLLKYSFDEANQRKSVSLVEISLNGLVAVEELRVPIVHDVVRISGRFEELIHQSVHEPAFESAYVEVVLTDPEPILNPADRLRRVFPHLLSIRREAVNQGGASNELSPWEVKSRDTLSLFGNFYEEVTGHSLEQIQVDQVSGALDELERQRREAR